MLNCIRQVHQEDQDGAGRGQGSEVHDGVC